MNMAKTKPDKKGAAAAAPGKEVRRTNQVQTQAPDGSFTMKLGNTTFTVGVHFSHTSDTRLEGAIKSLLSREAKECFTSPE